MIAKTPERQIKALENSIVYLTGLIEGLEKKLKDLETRLALLESRVTQPVGGPGKR